MRSGLTESSQCNLAEQRTILWGRSIHSKEESRQTNYSISGELAPETENAHLIRFEGGSALIGLEFVEMSAHRRLLLIKLMKRPVQFRVLASAFLQDI
jgi:hypothetical protein